VAKRKDPRVRCRLLTSNNRFHDKYWVMSCPTCEEEIYGMSLRNHWIAKPKCWHSWQKAMSAAYLALSPEERRSVNPEWRRWNGSRKLKCRRCSVKFWEAATVAEVTNYCIPCAIDRSDRKRPPTQAVCTVCGESFVAKRSDAKYCRNVCRQSAYRQR
jgi:hypothetical protein